MFNLFKPKKIYCVRWAWVDDGIPNQDIIRARDIAHAWTKLKRKHPYAAYCYSITEIKSEGFDEKEINK
jgi:hypothetical protein